MQTIAERAKSYVEGCELQGKEARKAEFDYIAGAKEERILVVEWLERNAPQVVTRFKEEFGMELPKYYGDDDSPSIYTVWVGGTEVTDNLLPKYKAERIAEDWRERGYDDVVVERYE